MPLPITTNILQAFVTEPMKPFLDVIIVSSQMHVYVSQTDRGEFLIGAEIEPYTTYSGKGTFSFLEYSAKHVLELFPQLERIRRCCARGRASAISRPTTAPSSGRRSSTASSSRPAGAPTASRRRPIVGTTLAELVATGETPELIAPFALERFHTDSLVSELAAAAVSH